MVGNSNGLREKDILWPPQLGRSINPSSIKGFFLGLSPVSSTYSRDLYLEGLFSLNFADVVAMLLGLIFFFLGISPCLLRLSPCLLRLIPCLFSLVSKFLSLLQLFLESCQLLLGSSQLVSGLTRQLSLAFSLSLCTLQGRVYTFPSVLLVSQSFLQLDIALFSNI